MKRIRKISRIEGFVNLCIVALLIGAIVLAFAIEMPAMQEEAQKIADSSDDFAAGLGAGISLASAIILAVIGAFGVGIAAFLILVSALVLLLFRKMNQGFSIFGSVFKILVLPFLLFVSVLAYHIYAPVYYIAVAVFLLGSFVFSIVCCVNRRRAKASEDDFVTCAETAGEEEVVEETAAPQEDYKN